MIRKLFSWWWRNWLDGLVVVEVTSWRSAIVETKSGAHRHRLEFCPIQTWVNKRKRK